MNNTTKRARTTKAGKLTGRVLKEVNCKKGALRLCKYNLSSSKFWLEVWAPLAGDWQPFAYWTTLEEAVEEMKESIKRFGGEVSK